MPREITYNWLDRPAELTAQEALFVSRLKANEDAAYDELVRMYSSPIYHVAYRMTGDAAEASDAVQDIFLKVFRNIGGFKGEAALKTWIFKIAFSEILNRLRWWKRRHRDTTLSLDEAPNGNVPGHGVADAGPTPEEVLQAKERENAIQQALRGSPTNIGPSLSFATSKVFLIPRSRTCWEFRWEPSNPGWRGLAPI